MRGGALGSSGRAGVLLMVAAFASGCDVPEPGLPDEARAEGYYETRSDLSVHMSGNVAEITVRQPPDQLRRGGSLWAKVGPYIYLFSESTRDLMDDYEGLAGVRVITLGPGGDEVARALLRRDALNAVTWRRALNIAGRARLDGSRRVTLIEQLVRWGEEHTTFEYDPRYAGAR